MSKPHTTQNCFTVCTVSFLKVITVHFSDCVEGVQILNKLYIYRCSRAEERSENILFVNCIVGAGPMLTSDPQHCDANCSGSENGTF